MYKRQLPAQTPAPEAGKVKRITRIEDTPEYAALQERFRAIHGENPYFVCHESPLMDTSVMDGHEVLNFGSYNYAGMSGRPETVNAAIEATRKYGTSASGSRLLGGEKKLHEQLEAAIAEWKHTEDALVLVSGHATNVTFVGNFCGKGDLIAVSYTHLDVYKRQAFHRAGHGGTGQLDVPGAVVALEVAGGGGVAGNQAEALVQLRHGDIGLGLFGGQGDGAVIARVHAGDNGVVNLLAVDFLPHLLGHKLKAAAGKIKLINACVLRFDVHALGQRFSQRAHGGFIIGDLGVQVRALLPGGGNLLIPRLKGSAAAA